MKAEVLNDENTKKLEKGAVAKMRESYRKLRGNTVSKELEEALKKKDQSKQDAPRKIAKPPQEVECRDRVWGNQNLFGFIQLFEYW